MWALWTLIIILTLAAIIGALRTNILEWIDTLSTPTDPK